ncbi:hypothetical protein M408DRAFT_328956 [Serendipita vermifera MAFF 305830]|uniref:Uncharacterized protein n=1 Tax=Serendipita vermifera MAFF 305830 TaxID=933852 RepID=A0A0C3BB11_SERVB|nr:hypothetical protein M408DRAFT_328956 [Serendipita vermifera MAFF 305830]
MFWLMLSVLLVEPFALQVSPQKFLSILHSMRGVWCKVVSQISRDDRLATARHHKIRLW